MPMALKLGTGSEAYAPLARAIIGGLSVSVALTVVHRAGGVSDRLPEVRAGERGAIPARRLRYSLSRCLRRGSDGVRRQPSR